LSIAFYGADTSESRLEIPGVLKSVDAGWKKDQLERSCEN
jgi:hypothetical protein